MIVDSICNAFTPDRRAVWDGALRRSGVPLKVQKEDDDGFAHPEVMVARMDELGLATLLLPTSDLGHHGTVRFRPGSASVPTGTARERRSGQANE